MFAKQLFDTYSTADLQKERPTVTRIRNVIYELRGEAICQEEPSKAWLASLASRLVVGDFGKLSTYKRLLTKLPGQ